MSELPSYFITLQCERCELLNSPNKDKKNNETNESNKFANTFQKVCYS